MTERFFETKLPQLGVIGSIVFMTVMLLLFGEITPKVIAVNEPERFAVKASRPIAFFTALFSPFRYFFEQIIRITDKLLMRTEATKDYFVSEAELKSLIRLVQKKGLIQQKTGDFIESLFTLKDTPVKAVMTPRTDMALMSSGTTIQQAVQFYRKKPFSRIPVYKTRREEIVGILYAKDLLEYHYGLKKGSKIKPLLHSPHFVPETKSAKALLKEMMRLKIQIAIAVDEHGGTAGMVTLDDLLEEMVGDISQPSNQSLIKTLPGGQSLIDGRTPISIFNRYFNASLKSEEYYTIGGVLLDNFGRLPNKQESIEIGNLRIWVVDVQGAKITRVLVEPINPEINEGTKN